MHFFAGPERPVLSAQVGAERRPGSRRSSDRLPVLKEPFHSLPRNGTFSPETQNSNCLCPRPPHSLRPGLSERACQARSSLRGRVPFFNLHCTVRARMRFCRVGLSPSYRLCFVTTPATDIAGARVELVATCGHEFEPSGKRLRLMSVVRRLPLSLGTQASAADEIVNTDKRDRFWGGTPPISGGHRTAMSVTCRIPTSKNGPSADRGSPGLKWSRSVRSSDQCGARNLNGSAFSKFAD
jgi:hypothetical protein